MATDPIVATLPGGPPVRIDTPAPPTAPEGTPQRLARLARVIPCVLWGDRSVRSVGRSCVGAVGQVSGVIRASARGCGSRCRGACIRPVLEDALARWDFAPVFVAVRAAQRPEPWTREVLGAFLGWEPRRVLAVETGRRPLVDVRAVVWVANQLGIPAGKLGFFHGVTVGGGATTGRKDRWVERRDFVEYVTTMSAAVAGLDIDRLIALLPQPAFTSTRHIGSADVGVIEQATEAYVRQDFATGSGPVRDLAMLHLNSVLPLLNAEVSDALRPRFYLATARLAMQAGWLSFDSKQHEAARRLWLIALDVARTAEDRLTTDHTVYLLFDMAIQALHLQRPDEALGLIHLGHTLAAGSHPVSAATSCLLAAIEAKAYAARGDAAGCDHALGRAIDHFSVIDPVTRPPWDASLDDARLAALQGHAHYTLAVTSRDARAAGRAVPLLRQALDGFGPSFSRSRALRLSDLAGAHALAGDTDAAVVLGHQAIDAVTALRSPLAYDGLGVLHTALEPLHTNPGVAELRERLRVTAA